MKKKMIASLLAVALIASSLVGCGTTAETPAETTEAVAEEPAEEAAAEEPAEIENVSLVLWGAEEDQAMLAEMVETFKAAYADKAVFDISIGVESESTAKDTVLTDIEAAADVFAFADDQLGELVNAGALQPVSINTEAIVEANGGVDAGSVKAASIDGTLYAYPMTADNGYFMFYNKEYFSEDDVKTFDKMLEVAGAAGKQITMQYDSGWYLYSFFAGAGLKANLLEDGVNNFCDWNGEGGVAVVESMLEIAKNPAFVSLNDAAFVTGVQDGTIIAGINGTWNAQVASDTWGENYAAAKLPTYTLNGEQVQMSSFAGYKLVGVNAYSEYAGWAMLLAEWLTNYENQVIRFETRGLGPSNVEAAASEAVQAAPAIAALAEQSKYATVQRIGANYWSATETFGAIIAAGNTEEEDLQTLLDNMVTGIVAPVE